MADQPDMTTNVRPQDSQDGSANLAALQAALGGLSGNGYRSSNGIPSADDYSSLLGPSGTMPPGAPRPPITRAETLRNAEQAVQFFMSKGWTREQAAGIVGNLMQESGLDPHCRPGDGGHAVGLAQWHEDRQQDFYEWSKTQEWPGKPRGVGIHVQQATFEQQLGFVNYELTEGKERTAGNALRRTRTPQEAAAVVDQKYERSSGAARADRESHAQQFAAGPPPRAPASPPTRVAAADDHHDQRVPRPPRDHRRRRDPAVRTANAQQAANTNTQPDANTGTHRRDTTTVASTGPKPLGTTPIGPRPVDVAMLGTGMFG